jgi:thiol-disulfide isomerase/thioredoxin
MAGDRSTGLPYTIWTVGRPFKAVVPAAITFILAAPVPAQIPDRSALQAAVDRFHAPDMDGRRVSTTDLRGRVVLMEFWATWCAPCLDDIPWIKQARAAHGDRLEVVGVSLDVIDRAAFVSWLRRHDVTWRQVYDGRGWSSPVIAPFDLAGIPFNVLVGPDGRVVGTNVRGEALLRTLAALFPDGSATSKPHRGQR